MTAGTLATVIAAAFGAMAVVATLAPARIQGSTAIAWRALAMSALFGVVAALMLLDALRRADLSHAYVVQHVTQATPALARMAAGAASAAGAGLLAAATAALFLVVWAPRTRDAALMGATVILILLAAPLAGAPMSRSPWTPLDGLNAVPMFRQPAAALWAVALLLAPAAALLALAHGMGSDDDEARGRTRRLALLTAFLALVQGVSFTWAALRSGVGESLAVATGQGGLWLITGLTAVVAALVLPQGTAHGKRADGAVLLLAPVIGSIALVLAGSGPPSRGVQVLGYGALVFCVVGCGMAMRGAVGGVRHAIRRPSLLGWTTLCCVVLALIGSIMTTTANVTLTSGQAHTANGATTLHLGVSRFDQPDAVVLAAALERRSGGRSVLGSAEQVEYFDNRGAVVGPVRRRPAVFQSLVTEAWWLTAVNEGDTVVLGSVTYPLWMMWPVAAAVALIGLLLAWLPKSSR